MTLDEFKDDSDWQEVFKYADKPTLVQLGMCPITPVKIEDVEEILAYSNGENDGDSWLGLFKINDGRYLYVEAGCDYTGWGCQENGSSWVSDSLFTMLQFGLTDEARTRFENTKDLYKGLMDV